MTEEIRDPGYPYTEEREHMARLCLPCENLEEGLYIHPGSASLFVSFQRTAPAEHAQEDFWVHARDFMVMQRERDRYRRTLSLINANLRGNLGPDGVARYDQKFLFEILDDAGFTEGDADAMASLLKAVSQIPDSNQATRENEVT